MNSTTQTYLVRLYDKFTMMQVTRTMPTTPKTNKALIATSESCNEDGQRRLIRIKSVMVSGGDDED